MDYFEHLLTGTDDETFYEEIANSLTHGFGAFFAAAGLYGLLALVINHEQRRKCAYSFWGSLIFGISLLLLYITSTVYHATGLWMIKAHRTLFHIMDHVAIFFLIAGTYTPLLLGMMKQGDHKKLAGAVLVAQWIVAVAGTILKLSVSIKDVPAWITNGLYLLMGWFVVFIGPTVIRTTHMDVLKLLVGGGLCYSFGVIFLTWKQLHFNHSIWHLFVLSGSVFHYCAVVKYVYQDHSKSMMDIIRDIFSCEHKEKKY